MKFLNDNLPPPILSQCRFYCAMLLLISPFALAQPSEKKAATETPPAAAKEEQSVEPAPTPQPDPTQQRLAARLPGDEVVWLEAADTEPRLLWLRPSFRQAPHGSVLILPPAQWPAQRDEPLLVLQQNLPEHGWQSAVLAPQSAAPDMPSPPAATSAQDASEDPKQELQKAPPSPSPAEPQRPARDPALPEALKKLAGIGPVILVAQGEQAQALLQSETKPSVAGLVLIDLKGIPEAEVFQRLQIPVLDLRTVNHIQAAEQQTERKRRSQRLGQYYQIAAVPAVIPAWSGDGHWLERTLRGWLKRLPDFTKP